MALLLREAIGGSLRRARTARHRSLRDVARAARVSLGYLSEVERGRKEASSELLAAICQALELPLPELLDDAARTLRPNRPDRGDAPALSRPLPATLQIFEPGISQRVSATMADEASAGIVVAA